MLTGLRVAAVIFGVMALVQVARLIIRPEIIIAGEPLPLWPSVVAAMVLAFLSVWMWRLISRALP